MADTDLKFPTGEAVTETLKLSTPAERPDRQLFVSMGTIGLYGFLRDALGAFPTIVASLPIPGVSFGIYNSPMMMSVGFMVGLVPLLFWFGGALFANFGIS